MRFGWYTTLCGVGLAAVLSAPARATSDPYPVCASVRLFARQAASAAILNRLADDFGTRRGDVEKAGGKALASTDAGYGARFRVRYFLHDAVVDEYSGIEDGALMTCRFTHARRFSEALAIARAKQGKAQGDTAIDFNRPVSRTASEIRYELDEGCVMDCVFKLDKSGACTEIQWSSAC